MKICFCVGGMMRAAAVGRLWTVISRYLIVYLSLFQGHFTSSWSHQSLFNEFFMFWSVLQMNQFKLIIKFSWFRGEIPLCLDVFMFCSFSLLLRSSPWSTIIYWAISWHIPYQRWSPTISKDDSWFCRLKQVLTSLSVPSRLSRLSRCCFPLGFAEKRLSWIGSIWLHRQICNLFGFLASGMEESLSDPCLNKLLISLWSHMIFYPENTQTYKVAPTAMFSHWMQSHTPCHFWVNTL